MSDKTNGSTATLTKKDFETDQEVRWCPGCGDYAILKAVQSVLPTLGVPKEKFVFVSGIGCSSRFPYYMNTYGFHTIHGRAFPIASGVKLANPDLSVWIVTGDGDALSIGGNHLIHTLRRNIDLTVLLFNNRIYGLTKGQTSPTSEQGKRTKSTPGGSIASPFNPIALALGAGATFVARSVDIYAKHLQATLKAAAAHRGTSFVEIYQNCNIFNDHAFEHITSKDVRGDNEVELVHGKPLVFGKKRDKGIRLADGHRPEIVTLGEGVEEKDLLVYDAESPGTLLPFMVSQLGEGFPTPIGIFRQTAGETYEARLRTQVDEASAARTGDLDALLATGDTWTVE